MGEQVEQKSDEKKAKQFWSGVGGWDQFADLLLASAEKKAGMEQKSDEKKKAKQYWSGAEGWNILAEFLDQLAAMEQVKQSPAEKKAYPLTYNGDQCKGETTAKFY